MRRPWVTIGGFAVGLALVLAAMAWVTVKVVELDAMEAQARRDAEQEERVRLALWRLDSLAGPLVAAESAQPYFAYTAFYPSERAWDRMLSDPRPTDVLLPSPLLRARPEHVRLHWLLGPDGRVTSPQWPEGELAKLARQRDLAPAGGEQAALEKLRGLLDPERLAAVLPAPDRTAEPIRVAAAEPRTLANVATQLPNLDEPPIQAQAPEPIQQVVQKQKSEQEYQAREIAYGNKGNYQQQLNAYNPPPPAVADTVDAGAMTALWLEGELLLARRVRIGERTFLQGAWLDWPDIRGKLLAGVRDLLPEARLVPDGEAPGEDGRRLASLPVRLLPGSLGPTAAAEDGPSPLTLSLLVAWAALLLGAGAVAALLVGALRLSERRGAFVSAVTHELRTPLTTFRMYTEMLSDGMVRDADKQARYLRTLRGEAERLGHLVENVLAYARLEKRSAEAHVEDLALADLLAASQERLADRAARADMALEIEATGDATVRVDPGAVERILFNLVDNACKYATSGEQRRIVVRAEARAGGDAVIAVRDFGPGIAEAERRRLFRPFHKSDREAARTAPGVGLGLALCRRLARAMGGDLRLTTPDGGGARFELVLPVTSG